MSKWLLVTTALAAVVHRCGGISTAMFSDPETCVQYTTAGGTNPFGPQGTAASLGSAFNATYNFNLGVGDRYVDFQVQDMQFGNFTTVSALLNRSAVMLVFGMMSDPYVRFSTTGGLQAEYVCGWRLEGCALGVCGVCVRACACVFACMCVRACVLASEWRPRRASLR
jgi:hypothetical protein